MPRSKTRGQSVKELRHKRDGLSVIRTFDTLRPLAAAEVVPTRRGGDGIIGNGPSHFFRREIPGHLPYPQARDSDMCMAPYAQEPKVGAPRREGGPWSPQVRREEGKGVGEQSTQEWEVGWEWRDAPCMDTKGAHGGCGDVSHGSQSRSQTIGQWQETRLQLAGAPPAFGGQPAAVDRSPPWDSQHRPASSDVWLPNPNVIRLPRNMFLASGGSVGQSGGRGWGVPVATPFPNKIPHFCFAAPLSRRSLAGRWRADRHPRVVPGPTVTSPNTITLPPAAVSARPTPRQNGLHPNAQ